MEVPPGNETCTATFGLGDGEQHEIRLGYFVSSLLSAGFSLTVLIVFALFKKFRSHPAELLMYLVLCDIAITIITIVSYSRSATANCGLGCNAAFGFVTQFASVSSVAWYGVISIDLLLAIRNPFSAYQDYTVMYHVLGWGVGLGSSVYAYFQDMFGLSMNQICWLKQEDRAFPVGIFVSYFLAMILALGFSIAVLVTARRSFGEGLPTTVETRRRILAQCSSYAKIFGPYWLAITGVWVAHHVAMHRSGAVNPTLIYVYMVLRGLQGPVGALAFFLNSPISLKRMWLGCCHRRRAGVMAPVNASLSAPLMQHDLPSPLGDGPAGVDVGEDINRALRREIILCTAWGITDSVRAGRRSSDPRPRRRKEENTTRKRIHLPHSFLVNKVFDFVTYFPSQFAELRGLCTRDPGEYVGSFTAPGQADEMAEQFTEGRSGSFFYFTHDRKYLVKTVTSQDYATLSACLAEYHQHLKDYPHSLLPRFLGLYAIRLSPEQRYIRFVVMQNVFSHATPALRRDLVFDLKGSSVKRRVVPESASLHSVSGTLKDLDLRHPVHIGAEAKMSVQCQLTADVTFLNSHGIMDYSLLLGVFRAEDPEVLAAFRNRPSDSSPEAPLFLGVASDQAATEDEEQRGGHPVYFGGLIDVLQRYTWTKRLENLAKRLLLCQDAHGISAIEPDEYALRFLKAMGHHMR